MTYSPQFLPSQPPKKKAKWWSGFSPIAWVGIIAGVFILLIGIVGAMSSSSDSSSGSGYDPSSIYGNTTTEPTCTSYNIVNPDGTIEGVGPTYCR